MRFDFPALSIGVATNESGPTGVTVFSFPDKALAAADVRGGAPSTSMFDPLGRWYGEDRGRWIDAVCFAGGSSYGLAATAGIVEEIRKSRRDQIGWDGIPCVPTAVVFDFDNRSNAVHPDYELGRKAFLSAKAGMFPAGSHGAGRNTSVGGFFGPRYMERGGQGGAFRQVGKTKIAVFCVVNALGVVVDRRGTIVAGNRHPITGNRSHIADHVIRATRKDEWGDTPPRHRNTTLTLAVTNQSLGYTELRHLAVQAHASMARAIQPFNTPYDGDIFIAATTGEISNLSLSPNILNILVSELAWDAVLSAVRAGNSRPGTKVLSSKTSR